MKTANSRTLFVHCGLHKTGTTAVQEVLARRCDALRAHGLLVPRAGSVHGCAHHNIAWQIARDRWFDPLYGTLDDVAREIVAFPGNAVLSSECFETLLDRADGFAPLLAHPLLRGHRKVLLLYVRNQVEYLESLAAELLRHGEGQEIASLLRTVLRHRWLRWHEWGFAFDHAASYRNAAAQAETVLVNAHTLRDGTAVADLLARVAPGYRPEQEDLLLRANPRQDIAGALELFYRNRVQRAPGPAETAAAANIARWLGGWPRLSAAGRTAMARRFVPGNAWLGLRGLLPARGLLRFAPPDATGPTLERVFSFETQALIRTLSRSNIPDAAMNDEIAAAFAAPPSRGMELDAAAVAREGGA